MRSHIETVADQNIGRTFQHPLMVRPRTDRVQANENLTMTLKTDTMSLWRSSHACRRIEPLKKLHRRCSVPGRTASRFASPLWQTKLAFTMVELLAVVAIIGVMVGLLLPAVQSSREAVRRISCSNNLMQIAVATGGYHNAFNQFPVQLSGTDGSAAKGLDNDRRLSIFVALLPFLDQQSLWDQLHQPMDRATYQSQPGYDGYGYGYADEGSTEMDLADAESTAGEKASEFWPVGGPEPFNETYAGWYVETPVMRCPSDPGTGLPSYGRNNYAACIGDGLVASDSGPMKDVGGTFVVDPSLAKQTDAAMRGIFVPRVVTRIDDVTDGLSNTLLLGEIATDLGDLDTRTMPVVASGKHVLRNEPGWARWNNVIDPDRPRFWLATSMNPVLENNQSARRGFRWHDGMPMYTSFNAIVSPNGSLVLETASDAAAGVFTTSSRHQGGAHVAFADGAVHFITDAVDTGINSSPTVYLGSKNPPGSESPFGVWGAMGTRASAELSGRPPRVTTE